MSWDHERVEELLSGHVLGGLDPEDAELAECALVEHVPDCGRCRKALDDFQAVAGDLALVSAPAVPPDTLHARTRRALELPGRGRSRLGWVAASVALLGVAGLGSWNAVLNSRITETEASQLAVENAISHMGHPNAEVVELDGNLAVQGHVVVLSVPGAHDHYLVASGLPEPEGVYQVWFLGRQGMWSAGSFTPTDGTVAMPVRTNMARWEQVMIVDAPDGGSPEPVASPLASARLSAA